MARRTLNLGILAHVDAGKTTLTERLLYEAGVIDEVGSVAAGTTQTDTMEMERQRGITIRSAVVSFTVGGVQVNLIDTPGHPDFIAEVERALSVLDGAVLVVSAVEGVQPQTRVLWRAIRRLRVPTLLFVNKVDRAGADQDRVLAAISGRLSAAVVPMGRVERIGTRAAAFVPWGSADAGHRAAAVEVLAGQDDSLLAEYVEDENAVTYRRLRAALAAQTKRALVAPVFLGSAVTAAGVDSLMAGLVELLPAAAGHADGPVEGRIFKMERTPAGEKVGYVRMFSGTVRTRDRLHTGRGAVAKVTAVGIFDDGAWVRRGSVGAGEIGKLWGLGPVRVGDTITAGEPHAGENHEPAYFAPPTMEAVVVARRPADRGALREALAVLAEQDPLIDVRQDDARQEPAISLYGEVQKEVVQATLADDFGIDVTFRETTTICIERPAGTGEAVAVLNEESNPHLATIGLRIDPAPPGSGIDFRLDVDSRTVPLYIYKNVASFAATTGEQVRRALRAGLFGWQVTDCTVTMTRCAYSSWDGPPSTRGPLSTAADFRKLTPLVLRRALEQAGTVVCEPILRVTVEAPADRISAVLVVLARLGAAADVQSLRGELGTVGAVLPAVRVRDLQRLLPELTGGEGVLESSFEGYQPVRSAPPRRPRRVFTRSESSLK